MITASERVRQWEYELSELTDDITDLLLTRRLWEDIKPHLSAHRQAFGQAVDLLYAWYVDAVLVRTRRLVDRDSRTHSLVTVLTDVGRHAEEITRGVLHGVWLGHGVETSSHRATERMLADWHLARITNEVPDADARSAIYSHSGPIPDKLTSRVIDTHLKAVDAVADRIRDVANQYVAHRDRKPRVSSFISNHELDDAAEFLAESYRRWRLLFGGPDMDLSIERLASTWTALLDRLALPRENTVNSFEGNQPVDRGQGRNAS